MCTLHVSICVCVCLTCCLGLHPMMMSCAHGPANIKEAAVQKLNSVLKDKLNSVRLCLKACCSMLCAGLIDPFIGHGIIDEMGTSVCVVFTNIWSWVKVDEKVCIWLCVHPDLGNWCYVLCPWRQPLSFSHCQSISHSFSLVTLDRLDTIEHLVEHTAVAHKQNHYVSVWIPVW